MRLVLMLCLVVVSPSLYGQSTRALIASGVAGNPAIAEQFERDGAAIRDAIEHRFGGQVAWLTDRSTPRSDKAGITRAIRELAAAAQPADRILIVLIGHGSAQGGEARFNIPGPDLTAAELAKLLELVSGREVAVVLATSASGAFIPALSGAGRTIIAATRSGAENEETVFPRFFSAALSQDVADTDKDGSVSMAEAFTYAKREVARFYQQKNLLATEHAVLDDNGDGTGSLSLDGGDGARAQRFVLRPASSMAMTPELRVLYDQRAELQRQIEALRTRKEGMAAAAYDAELERLLLELARKSQDIRAAERNH